MALLLKNNISKHSKERNSVHKETKAHYCVFEEQGKLYFQIDTFGSADRIEQGKVSQSLQIDKEMAIELIKILRTEFISDVVK